MPLSCSTHQIVTQIPSAYRTRVPSSYDQLLAVISSLTNWIPYLDVRAWLGTEDTLSLRLVLIGYLPLVLMDVIFTFLFRDVFWIILSYKNT